MHVNVCDIIPLLFSQDIIMPRGVENTVAVEILLQHVRYRLRKQAAGLPSRSSVPLAHS